MWASKQIKEQDFESFAQDARDYALINGVVKRYPSVTNDNCVGHVPFTLFPSPFPKKLYEQCLDIQPIINRLMLRIANDSVFMQDSLESVLKVDDFTRNLMKINLAVQKEGLAQPVISCIDRSDYMLDKYIEDGEKRLRIRQVEVNAIASAMSAFSDKTAKLHNYLQAKYQIKRELGTLVPENKALQLIAEGLIDAYNAYDKPNSYILFVIEDRSLNFADQLNIELTVHNLRPDIRVVRRRFYNLDKIIKLGPNKELIVDGVKEVAVVYFRNCYDPSNYNYSNAWQTRLLLERSRAIKCPSINFHLSGAKKFQQVLNNQEQLERFLSSAEANKLTKVFCKFWSVGAENNLDKTCYKSLVLKPQREGGGHNIFGDDIEPFLGKITNQTDLSQYILMELINCPTEKNWILTYTDETSIKFDTNDQLVSELGIYGSILGEGNIEKSNHSAGYLVRSKKSGIKEGGISSGGGSISSAILVDEKRENVDLSLFYDDY